MIITDISYLIASILFILGIKKLSHPKSAQNGNMLAAIGMLIAILATLFSEDSLNFELIVLGVIVGTIIGAIFAK